jgi:hypothetical protein
MLHYTYEYARTIMDIRSMQFFSPNLFFTDNYEGDRDRKAGIGQHIKTVIDDIQRTLHRSSKIIYEVIIYSDHEMASTIRRRGVMCT